MIISQIGGVISGLRDALVIGSSTGIGVGFYVGTNSKSAIEQRDKPNQRGDGDRAAAHPHGRDTPDEGHGNIEQNQQRVPDRGERGVQQQHDAAEGR